MGAGLGIPVQWSRAVECGLLPHMWVAVAVVVLAWLDGLQAGLHGLGQAPVDLLQKEKPGKHFLPENLNTLGTRACSLL